MNLLYDRNYIPKGSGESVCPSCGVVCSSTRAFDKHRVGEHGVDRRCLENPIEHPELCVDYKGRLSLKKKNK